MQDFEQCRFRISRPCFVTLQRSCLCLLYFCLIAQQQTVIKSHTSQNNSKRVYGNKTKQDSSHVKKVPVVFLSPLFITCGKYLCLVNFSYQYHDFKLESFQYHIVLCTSSTSMCAMEGGTLQDWRVYRQFQVCVQLLQTTFGQNFTFSSNKAIKSTPTNVEVEIILFSKMLITLKLHVLTGSP